MARYTAKQFRQFLQGMGSALEIWPPPGTQRKISQIGRSGAVGLKADWAALCADGEKVGRDTKAVLNR